MPYIAHWQSHALMSHLLESGAIGLESWRFLPWPPLTSLSGIYGDTKMFLQSPLNTPTTQMAVWICHWNFQTCVNLLKCKCCWITQLRTRGSYIGQGGGERFPYNPMEL